MAAMMIEAVPEVNRAFSAYFRWMGSKSWGVMPQAGH
jgi:hypothetical protein